MVRSVLRIALVATFMIASRGIAYESQSLTRGTEQLPLEDLPRFAQAKEGDLVMMQPHESRMPLMLIQSIHDSPVGVDRALTTLHERRRRRAG